MKLGARAVDDALAKGDDERREFAGAAKILELRLVLAQVCPDKYIAVELKLAPALLQSRIEQLACVRSTGPEMTSAIALSLW